MRVVMDAVEALLKAELPVTCPVYRSAAPSRPDPTPDLPNRVMVLEKQLPYIILRSNVGDDDNPRLSGQRTRRSVLFRLSYVGLTEDHAKLAGEGARLILGERHIAVPGHRTWRTRVQESQSVWTDFEAVNLNGVPLHIGVDSYATSITISEFKGSTA